MIASWNDTEIDIIVADYMQMLRWELDGIPFNKAERNRDLQELISRSRGSIEFKHQNISAVLCGMGQPWITGYKPAKNFQNALIDGVLRWLNLNKNWLSPMMRASRSSAQRVASPPTLWFGPPPTLRNEPSPIDAEFMAEVGRKYDVAQRDERNRELGKAGEELVFEHEMRTLTEAGKRELASKVRWTSVEDGDGYGYDIRSYEVDGRERLLEVKTTNGWDRTPFHITANELKVANLRQDSWRLVRIWNFAREPKAFELRPPLESHAELTATSFLAHLH